MECTQVDCNEEAKYKYVWPGADHHGYACEKHKNAVMNIANAMGFGLLIEPIEAPND